MNRHFEDARYYLKRAALHMKAGIEEEIQPAERRLRHRLGREPAPEPTRLERIEAELRELEQKAEGEAREAVSDARDRVRRYRAKRNTA